MEKETISRRMRQSFSYYDKITLNRIAFKTT